jgi:acyl dehydratase
MSEPLPTWRVKARNTSAGGENKIHDDEVARRHGFPGGLVPGVTVYAYLVHPLAEALGAAWLQRGTADLRLVRPVLEGEELTAAGEIVERTPQGLTARVAGATASGESATLAATLPAGSPTPVNAALYPRSPLPVERPEATREHLAGLSGLGTPEAVYDTERASAYLDGIAEPLPLFHGAGGWVHPAFFLDQANRAIDRNVRLGPWIHVSSRVRHLGGARVGERLETRGRVRSVWEKNAREYVEVDLLLVAGTRPVAHVLHTAIFHLRGERPPLPPDAPHR